MNVETRLIVSNMPLPTAEEQLMARDKESYRAELHSLVHKLGNLSSGEYGVNFSLDDRRRIAYAIAGDDIPLEDIRQEMTKDFCRGPELERTKSMQALDGGYHAMWARARNA